MFASALACAPAFADDASCGPVLQSQMKQARTAFHETSSSKGAPLLEKIYTTSALYLRRGTGRWTKVPATPQDLIDAMRETGVSLSSCRRVREDAVDGQPAAVWAAHQHTAAPAQDVDIQIWISDASGLPLRTESDQRGTHVSTRLVYENVRPPAGAN